MILLFFVLGSIVSLTVEGKKMSISCAVVHDPNSVKGKSASVAAGVPAGRILRSPTDIPRCFGTGNGAGRCDLSPVCAQLN